MPFKTRLKNKNIQKGNKKDDLEIFEIDLFRRLEEKGCPVCGVLEPHDRRYFSWFSIEKYHEPVFLESLARALGFCDKHGAYLDQQGHWGSQITVVHKHTASHVLNQLCMVLSEKKSDFRSFFRDRTSCPVCTSYQETSERTLWFFKKIIKNIDGWNKYGCPGILCFSHLKGLTHSISPSMLGKLLLTHEAAILSATQALERIIRKKTEVSVESEQIQDALNLSVGREQDPGHAFFRSRIHKAPENRDPETDFISSLTENTGCPVCLEIFASLGQWIQWLNKNITSTHSFEALRDVLPTCNTHVWTCIRLGKPALQFAAASAALHAVHEKIRIAGRHFKRSEETRRRSIWKQMKDKYPRNLEAIKADPRKTITSPIYCPVCNRMNVAKNRALELLFALLQERRHRIDFENGYGLCLKHFADALDMQPSNKIGRFLTRVESAKLSLLEWELEETMRKMAWTARPEIKGSEQSAWHRALTKFSGLPIR